MFCHEVIEIPINIESNKIAEFNKKIMNILNKTNIFISNSWFFMHARAIYMSVLRIIVPTNPIRDKRVNIEIAIDTDNTERERERERG
jgi:hypothetical protein